MAKFRYDINALRAIAVLSVLLFHLKLSFFSGGFVGVDIFFVISGYLMTKIILEGLQNNKFSVWDFYAKRIKRIVPALVFLILCITIVGFFIYLPIQYKQNEKNAYSSLLFFSNILYWKNSTSYFASAAENNVLLHTWSLSAEWQFYLIYPLVLIIISRVSANKAKLANIFIGVLVTFALLSIAATYKAPAASFFLLPTRTWELMTGGLAFIMSGKIKSRVLLILSYLAIVFSIIFFNETLLWPGVCTVMPVIATFLIITINHDEYLVFRNKPVQLLGKTSYSIYLWHWPIIVFARYLGYNLEFGTVVFVILSSMVIAFFSFYYIESMKFQNVRGIIAITACLAGLTIILANMNSNNWLFKSKTLELESYPITHKEEIDGFLGQCFTLNADDIGYEELLKKDCLSVDTSKQNVLLIGDSHAAMLANVFRETFVQKNINFVTISAAGQLPVLAVKFFRPVYFDYLKKNKKNINKIILEGNWCTGSFSDLTETITYLKKLNIPVVVIGQTNAFTISFPAITARWNENKIDNTELYTDKKAYECNQLYKFKLKPYYVNVYYYSNIPRLGPNNEPFMTDRDHLSRFGADLVVKKIFKDTLFRKQILGTL